MFVKRTIGGVEVTRILPPSPLDQMRPTLGPKFTKNIYYKIYSRIYSWINLGFILKIYSRFTPEFTLGFTSNGCLLFYTNSARALNKCKSTAEIGHIRTGFLLSYSLAGTQTWEVKFQKCLLECFNEFLNLTKKFNYVCM